jgi:hypothetical protein
MDHREPDVAALAERLGMRGMRYRSFGNPPYRGTRRAAPAAPAPEAPMPVAQSVVAAPPHAPTMAAFAHMPPPASAPSSWPATSVALAPPSPAPAFPLIAQALTAASNPASPQARDVGAEAAPPGALPFLALRAAVRGAGD